MSRATDIADRYGCDQRTVHRWDEFGRTAGEAPPWQEGAAVLLEWANKHGRKIPDWLQAAGLDAATPSKPPAVSVDGEALETDSVEVLQGLIDSFNAQIRVAKQGGAKPAQLAALGKDYAKLCTALDKMKAERRACDDNLIDKAKVIDAIDRLHASIPGRLIDDFIAGLDELCAAHAAGKGREAVELFFRNSLTNLAGSFADHLKEAA